MPWEVPRRIQVSLFWHRHHDFTRHPGFPGRASQALAAVLWTDGGDEADRCCRTWWIALQFQTTQPFSISSFFMPIRSSVFKCHSCFLMCKNLSYTERMIRPLAFSGNFKLSLPSPFHPRHVFLMENRLYFLILYVAFCSLESPLVPCYHYYKQVQC